MEIHSEAGTSLKVSLLFFALVLIGVLVYFVYQQDKELTRIYATAGSDEVVTRHSIVPPKVDTPSPTP